jgi:hypothetical protein
LLPEYVIFRRNRLIRQHLAGKIWALGNGRKFQKTITIDRTAETRTRSEREGSEQVTTSMQEDSGYSSWAMTVIFPILPILTRELIRCLVWRPEPFCGRCLFVALISGSQLICVGVGETKLACMRLDLSSHWLGRWRYGNTSAAADDPAKRFADADFKAKLWIQSNNTINKAIRLSGNVRDQLKPIANHRSVLELSRRNGK